MVAKDYVGGTFSMGQIIRADGYDSGNPCANYHETGDGGATWRVPNLVEFSAMHAAGEELQDLLVTDGDACCTQFSNQNVRYGFRMNQGQIQCWGGESWQGLGDNPYRDDDTFRVRCVRDVK